MDVADVGAASAAVSGPRKRAPKNRFGNAAAT